MSALLVQNIKQQTKRLIDQLNELEELRAEITQQEYDEMKKDTVEALQTFQKSLSGFQKGEISLDSEIERAKQELMNAVRKSLNKQEIQKHFEEAEINSLRSTIKNLETQLQMKVLTEKDFSKSKMEAILHIKSLNGQLTVEQKVFISTDNQFSSKDQFSMNTATSSEYLGAAQKQIADKLKQ